MDMRIFPMLLLLIIITKCSAPKVETPEACTEAYLLYLSKASGNFDIYKNDLRGTETQLTINPSWDWAPRWDASSQSILHNAYVNDTFRIRFIDINGRFIDEFKGLDEYNVSPDGNWLIAQFKAGDSSKLIITNALGEDPRDITALDSYNGRAVWSPDSKQVIYISDRDGNNEIYHYSLVTGLTTRLTENKTFEKYLTWAPDSETIAYTTEYFEEGQPDRNDVFVMELESKKITQITDNPYEDSEISWSPLGDKIAFHSKRDSIDHIYLMNIDGTHVEQVTSKRTYHGEPAWAYFEISCPDGQ